jgi:hypothetical protein
VGVGPQLALASPIDISSLPRSSLRQPRLRINAGPATGARDRNVPRRWGIVLVNDRGRSRMTVNSKRAVSASSTCVDVRSPHGKMQFRVHYLGLIWDSRSQISKQQPPITGGF